MLELLGGALVLLASGSFGITAGVRYYRASRHLQAFCRAVELLRCEINYSCSRCRRSAPSWRTG
ncbi:MAG: hypothetical protein ACLRR6_10235 [Oscillospiraceae bacterium]